MLTALVKERHDDVDSVSLSGGGGDNPLEILVMIVRGHMIYMTADSIGFAVIGNIYHDKQIRASN